MAAAGAGQHRREDPEAATAACQGRRAAKVANSRGGGEPAVRELQGRRRPRWPRAPVEGEEAGCDGELHPLTEEAGEAWTTLEEFFSYIHATWRHLKGYGSKWHNLTSSGCQNSILRVRGPK